MLSNSEVICKFLIRGNKDRLTWWLGPLNAEETARLGSKLLTNCRTADWTNEDSQVKMARAKKTTANDYVMVSRSCCETNKLFPPQIFPLPIWKFPFTGNPSKLDESDAYLVFGLLYCEQLWALFRAIFFLSLIFLLGVPHDANFNNVNSLCEKLKHL